MQEILKEVISWAIPIICTGIMAYILIPFKKAQKQKDKGKELMEQEEWDSHSGGLVKKIDNIKQDQQKDKDDIMNEIMKLQAHDKQIDKILSEILVAVKQNNSEISTKFEDMDKKNTAAFIQIYQRDLIIDGKDYLARGFITPQQLSNYEKRYKQYKDWGGNGDVEVWIGRIRQLPVRYPDQE